MDEVVEITGAIADTGATWTTIPRSLADQLRLDSLGLIRGHTASGVQILEQSFVHTELAEKRTVTPVLISDTLDAVLIGVLTLEALALAVDPGTGRLKDSDILLL
jgi:predicted aspartyl protease